MVIAGAVLTWTFAALYFALVTVWAVMTIGVWWRRRHAAPNLAGDLPDLDPYELARLDRGRYGQIEVMLAQLLESGVVGRGVTWGDRLSSNPYGVVVRSALPPGAHELERAFVRAIGQWRGIGAWSVASYVTYGEPCDQIEARLREAGLLYDESRRWRVAWFGWALFGIGLSWSIARSIVYGAPVNDLTVWLFIIGGGLLLPVFISQPDTAGQVGATPNGRLVVERACGRHKALRESFSAPDVRLAVALFGADTARHDHAGVRDTYELLKAASKDVVG